MIVKRKLFSFIDKDGNQGYYLYNKNTGEEKLFSVIEEERVFGEVKRANKAAKRAAILKKASGAVSKEEIEAMRNRIEGSELMQRLRGKKGPVFSESKIKDMVKVINARQAARGFYENFEIASSRGRRKLNFDALRDNNKRSPEAKNRRLEVLRLENYLKEEEKRKAERAAKKAAEAEKAAQNKLNAEKAALRKKRVAVVGKLKAKKASAKNAKIGAGIAAGTAAVGIGAYLAKKYHDKKKNEKKED